MNLSYKKILVVDDSASMRNQIREVLTSAGFQTIEAADGVEGLQTIVSRDDLAGVVCDVNMPRMGGLQMLELLKAKGLLERLPVVMLTTEGQASLVQQAKAAGAKGWVVKPFKSASLIAAVLKVTGSDQ
jgi:two-component system, chemotaxis family, chemotaxis protein CheY